ncbi:hypothetical protein PGB90_008049 [Kerria lacca]
MINFLTLIHEIHKELRDAAVFLQKAYGLPLLFSLCCLSIMLLFDIYFEFYGFIGGNNSRLNWATYVWCLQYCVRFTLIVQIPQKIYDEGVKTKYLICRLNDRNLDRDTKEELTLFMNHVINSKTDFTACDFFTLNTRLITSAIAAGTTYLVILVQFNLDKDP